MYIKIYIIITCFSIFFAGCIKLDFFLFDTDKAESIEKSYHGLPMNSGTNSPSWVKNAAVEREIYLSPEGKVLSSEQLSSQSSYIHGCFLKSPDCISTDTCPLAGRNVTFIYTHGNSGDLFRYWYRAVSLWSMGANVFIFTYRGYGLSKGEVTRANIKQDAEAAAAYVKSRSDVDTNKIFIYGYSMGGVTASYLAGASSHKNSFAGLILESALDNPEKIIGLSSGIDFPDGFFLDKEPYNGPEFVKGIKIPVLHFHGSNDERVIIEQAYSYYNVLKDYPKYTHYIGKSNKPDEAWISQASHRNIPLTAFKAPNHIVDYWDDAQNKSHCCINPFEYDEPQFQEFLSKVGNTTGSEMKRTSDKYRALVSGWILQQL
jgi:fermentation-respiration switch protein FrsA (DUF1100 family)